MNAKLYVGNLSFDTNEAALRDAFGAFGTLTDVHIAHDRETGRPRGFAFVTFSTEAECAEALEKMNGAQLDGRSLAVKEAIPKDSAGGGPIGGGGGGRNFGPNRRAGAFHQRNNKRR
jgi:cold-inducible RNA-binding protein